MAHIEVQRGGPADYARLVSLPEFKAFRDSQLEGFMANFWYVATKYGELCAAKCIGGAYYAPDRSLNFPCAEIRLFGIKPKYRGRGWGDKSLSALEAYLIRAHNRWVVFGHPLTERAAGWFEKRGYAVEGAGGQLAIKVLRPDRITLEQYRGALARQATAMLAPPRAPTE
jgi:GNAT superfamily N-acetyltransferase